jgi:perosamine synthetase
MSFRIPLSAPDITQAEIDAVTNVLRTPQLSLGQQLNTFETELAEYHSVPHAIAVSSGTAGLHIALLTLGIRSGDEVIVPSFAFIAVANAVLQAGASPVFADIDPVTLNLDPARVEEAITIRTRAIIVVHTFGVPAQMDLLRNLALQRNLVILEDACEAIGATFQRQPVGSFGDLSVLGFYPNKQITTGEGGAVLARSTPHAERLRSLRNQGRAGTEWLDHAEPGYNYRLSELACALGRVQLGRLDEMLALRNAAADRYLALLADIPCLELPPARLPDRTISWFVFVVRIPDEQTRNRAQSALAARGIATGRYFAPIHLQPAWQNHPRARVNLPITEAVAPRTLALPLFNRITEQQQHEVARSLAEILIP